MAYWPTPIREIFHVGDFVTGCLVEPITETSLPKYIPKSYRFLQAIMGAADICATRDFRLAMPIAQFT